MVSRSGPSDLEERPAKLDLRLEGKNVSPQNYNAVLLRQSGPRSKRSLNAVLLESTSK